MITLDENRNRQKYNDNVFAVDYSRGLGKGTLTLGAKTHVDIYNLYGGWNKFDPSQNSAGVLPGHS